jgi:hypothetical protein
MHMPYKWRLARKDSEWDLAIAFDLDLSPLEKAGFTLLDPASYFDDPDGNRWLALCCSERTWFWGQRILSLLYPVRITNPNGAFIRAMQPYLCAKSDLAHGISIYPRQTCIGPISSIRGAGGLLLGQPSIFHVLPQPLHGQNYHCDFYYKGHADDQEELAQLVFYLCDEKNEPKEMILSLPLMGTKGALRHINFDFPSFPPGSGIFITCQYRWLAPLEVFQIQIRERRADWPRKYLYGDV